MRRSGCRRSTRPSRSAARTGSATAFGSPTTSPIGDDGVRGASGALANYVRDKRIPLELCPSSNVQTGAVEALEKHPFDLLARLRFRVTVNTDNRLMSDTSMSQEMLALSRRSVTAGPICERYTINAMKSAFIPFPQRLQLIDEVDQARYAC